MATSTSIMKKWSEAMRGLSRAGIAVLPHHSKYGLFDEDILFADEPLMKEALRRLPQAEADARAIRVHRAIHMSGADKQLETDEALKVMDEDRSYLSEYLYEVLEEEAERSAFRQ